MIDMKVRLAALFLTGVAFNVQSQLLPTSEVSIVSPKAASILRYGEYPVSLYTGLVDISIPIYAIEGSGVSVPIELKYHASGYKFDDVSSEVGLGWSLLAGGVITRTIRGARDGRFGTFSKDVNTFVTCSGDSPLANDYVRLREVENGSQSDLNYDPSLQRLDGETDIYSYSFLGHSGSFCFPHFDSDVVIGTNRSTGVFIPLNGMKVVDRSQPELKLVLLDRNGISYTFEVRDVDQNKQYLEYYLTRVVSSDKADTVDFVYEVVSPLSSEYVKKPFINYTSSIVTTIRLDHHGFTQTEPYESGGVFYQMLRPPRLLRINFREGYMLFEYREVDGVRTYDLGAIKLFGYSEEEALQVVTLKKGMFENGEARLDTVEVTNSDGEALIYSFGYDGEPGNMASQSQFEKGIDYWGYFNGKNVPSGKRYVPTFTNMPTGMITGIDRSANESFMRRGVVNRITYPTGGYSIFTYEAHKARLSQGAPVLTFGGLRIAEIRDYNSDGSLALRKWYRYGEDESGLGIANRYPDIEDFRRESRRFVRFIFEASTALQLKISKHWSVFPKLSYFLSGSSVVYGTVTEYVGDSADYYSKTEHHYEVFPDEDLPPESDTYRWRSPDMPLRTNAWKSGNLRARRVFKKGVAAPIYELWNTYEDISRAEFRNVRVLSHVDFEHVLAPGVYQNIPDIAATFCSPEYDLFFRPNFGGSSPIITPYDYFNYYTSTGLRALKVCEEKKDGVVTRTSYYSYTADGLPVAIGQLTSGGEEVVTTFRYPTDFEQGQYTGMVQANILTPVVEKTTSKNGVHLKTEAYRYVFWHDRFYAPLRYEERYGDGNFTTKVSYNYDIHGNINQIWRDGYIDRVYLWGYRGRYPVAEIANASHEQIENILGKSLLDRLADDLIPNGGDLKAVDDLRLNSYVPSMHLRTFTYRPLIGMTSQTDFNGKTTYFSYDTFRRLTTIRDSHSNILYQYRYNYAR